MNWTQLVQDTATGACDDGPGDDTACVSAFDTDPASLYPDSGDEFVFPGNYLSWVPPVVQAAYPDQSPFGLAQDTLLAFPALRHTAAACFQSAAGDLGAAEPRRGGADACPLLPHEWAARVGMAPPIAHDDMPSAPIPLPPACDDPSAGCRTAWPASLSQASQRNAAAISSSRSLDASPATVHVVVDCVVWHTPITKQNGGIKRVWQEVLPRLLTRAPPHFRFTLLQRGLDAPGLALSDLSAFVNAQFLEAAAEGVPRVTVRHVPPFPFYGPASNLELDVRHPQQSNYCCLLCPCLFFVRFVSMCCMLSCVPF